MSFAVFFSMLYCFFANALSINPTNPNHSTPKIVSTCTTALWATVTRLSRRLTKLLAALHTQITHLGLLSSRPSSPRLFTPDNHSESFLVSASPKCHLRRRARASSDTQLPNESLQLDHSLPVASSIGLHRRCSRGSHSPISFHTLRLTCLLTLVCLTCVGETTSPTDIPMLTTAQPEISVIPELLSVPSSPQPTDPPATSWFLAQISKAVTELSQLTLEVGALTLVGMATMGVAWAIQKRTAVAAVARVAWIVFWVALGIAATAPLFGLINSLLSRILSPLSNSLFDSTPDHPIMRYTSNSEPRTVFISPHVPSATSPTSQGPIHLPDFHVHPAIAALISSFATVALTLGCVLVHPGSGQHPLSAVPLRPTNGDKCVGCPESHSGGEATPAALTETTVADIETKAAVTTPTAPAETTVADIETKAAVITPDTPTTTESQPRPVRNLTISIQSPISLTAGTTTPREAEDTRPRDRRAVHFQPIPGTNFGLTFDGRSMHPDRAEVHQLATFWTAVEDKPELDDDDQSEPEEEITEERIYLNLQSLDYYSPDSAEADLVYIIRTDDRSWTRVPSSESQDLHAYVTRVLARNKEEELLDIMQDLQAAGEITPEIRERMARVQSDFNKLRFNKFPLHDRPEIVTYRDLGRMFYEKNVQRKIADEDAKGTFPPEWRELPAAALYKAFRVWRDAAALRTREREGQQGYQCPKCNTIAYGNPERHTCIIERGTKVHIKGGVPMNKLRTVAFTDGKFSKSTDYVVDTERVRKHTKPEERPIYGTIEGMRKGVLPTTAELTGASKTTTPTTTTELLGPDDTQMKSQEELAQELARKRAAAPDPPPAKAQAYHHAKLPSPPNTESGHLNEVTTILMAEVQKVVQQVQRLEAKLEAPPTPLIAAPDLPPPTAEPTRNPPRPPVVRSRTPSMGQAYIGGQKTRMEQPKNENPWITPRLIRLDSYPTIPECTRCAYYSIPRELRSGPSSPYHPACPRCSEARRRVRQRPGFTPLPPGFREQGPSTPQPIQAIPRPPRPASQPWGPPPTTSPITDAEMALIFHSRALLADQQRQPERRRSKDSSSSSSAIAESPPTATRGRKVR
jgi:hypothetical protein